MTNTPEHVVRTFFSQVRSGRNINQAFDLMAPIVQAHQLTSEDQITVERSPKNYADHVQEMLDTFGLFKLDVTELLVQNDRVYVRWTQTGKHLGKYEEFQPTGLPILQIASAVYRVTNGKIVEYWMQIDRAGLRAQFERNAQSGISLSK